MSRILVRSEQTGFQILKKSSSSESEHCNGHQKGSENQTAEEPEAARWVCAITSQLNPTCENCQQGCT